MLVFVQTALGGVPLDTFPQCGEQDRPDLCPIDLEEDWAFLSYIPEGSRDSVRPAELALGSGVSADRAWQITTGRWDATLAVADSGILWENAGVQNKVWLNVAELPLPQSADGKPHPQHDVDGNGLVNVQDYALDPRVTMDSGRDTADHLLDASDLIAVFSDGVDDDGNGYVDDIAGWDFFNDDNDPTADLLTGYGDHGDGIITRAGAEGGDYDGDIGICPNCAIMPLRIGSAFLVDGDRVADAIAYASENGAVSVSLAIGSLSTPGRVRDAVALAEANDVVLVAASGDENSYHHNYPAVLDSMLYVHSIRGDNRSEPEGVYSFMNTLNCNNYGPRLDLVASSEACATGAVASIVGVVGLVVSAARDHGVVLSAAQIRALLRQTADDVHLSDEELLRSRAYPSEEGWDAFFGYGRVNAYRAVSQVLAGQIPPTIEIEGPQWFETITTDGATLSISGNMAAQTAFDWRVQVGRGHEPSNWVTLASGTAEQEHSGELARLSLSDLASVEVSEAHGSEGVLGRMERVFKPAVTVLVQATDQDGHTTEERRTFFYHPDSDVLPGFPIAFDGSVEASPILADFDEDGVFEVVLGTADGDLWVVDGGGQALDGFPVSVQGSILATPAVGDLDGDGVVEVVVATTAGVVAAWHADGTEVSGFPVYTIGRDTEEFTGANDYDQGVGGAPTLEDLDGDGQLEIIIGGMDARVYVFDHQGADWGPYPMVLCHPENCGWGEQPIVSSISVADLDGDGDFEFGVPSAETVNNSRESVAFVLDANTGLPAQGWPTSEAGLVNEGALLPIIGSGHPAAFAFGDTDGDGDLEVVNAIMLGQTDLLDHQGQSALELSYFEGDFGAGSNLDVPSVTQMVNHPALGDLDGDGTPDIVMGAASSTYLISLFSLTNVDFQHAALAWSGKDGSFLKGWPRQVEDVQFLASPAIADVSGDGKNEAIFGSGGYLVHAWDAEGSQPEGWPKFTGGWILGSPAVGDIDGDGFLDVVAVTREGFAFAWSTKGPADAPIEWQSIHHDPRNTGNYETPLVLQQGPPPEQGCCAEDGNKVAWVALLPLLLVTRRRYGPQNL